MPKPNQTMLDQLVKTFKSTGNTAPFREMKLHGEFTDPMIKARANQQLAGNKLIKVDPSWRTPERVKYQRGLDVLQQKGVDRAEEELADLRDDYDTLQSEFDDAFEEAKSDMLEDWRYGVDDETALDLREGFDPAWDLKVSEPNTNINDYWPSDYDTPEEFLNKADHLDTDIDEWEGIVDYRRDDPRYRMELQRQSPRYRNYQRAMRQRQENAQVGRLNAAIMNLYRRGYSMPEIREILRNQRMR